jgi:hypothetical protein
MHSSSKPSCAVDRPSESRSAGARAMNDENARPAVMKATTTAVRARSSWAAGSAPVVVTSAPCQVSNRFDTRLREPDGGLNRVLLTPPA